MAIKQTELKVLWGRAGSSCSICRRELTEISCSGTVKPVGEAAHIVAEKEKGPRGQSILGPNERNTYFNLILLCPTCHALVDKDAGGYPIERLHMLKAQHEMRVKGDLVLSAAAQVPDANPSEATLEGIIPFVKAWIDFLPFYFKFFTLIQFVQMAGKESDFFQGTPRPQFEEWHQRRDLLKELLYKAGESNLIVQEIPAWERLKRSSEYISENGYLTPFSFILDFINPLSMVRHHGDELWGAANLSQDFLDYLSFEHREVKEMWRINA